MTSENNYKSIFSYQLHQEQYEDYVLFFEKCKNAMFFQHPDWIALSQPNRKINYFMLYSDGILVATSTIIENKIVANVMWGPLCNSIETYVDSVEIIKKNYKRRKNFAVLRVTQPNTISSVTEKTEYEVYKRAPFEQFINDKNLFTIAVNLEKSEEEILAAFNKSNKRGAKKGIKEGFSVREIESTAEAKKFAAIYDLMIVARGIENQFDNTAGSFKKMLDVFQKNNFGKMLAIYNSENVMMGGIMILFKDDYVHYDTGASSPEFRKLPIMHSLFYQAMLLSKQKGHKWFDLGGYNLISADGDQVTNINKFKEGFAGVPRIYPKKMYFTLNPIVNGLYKLVAKIKK